MNQVVYYLDTLNSDALKYASVNKYFIPRTLGTNEECILLLDQSLLPIGKEAIVEALI